MRKNPRQLFVSVILLAIALATISAGAREAAVESGDVRFASVDLLIDSGAEPLAAWQLEWSDPSGRASLVGIEGGEHPAYVEPARYDPRALAGGRVVLAAFSLSHELPSGRTRVARLHLEIRGADPLLGECRLIAAAGAEGRELDARVVLTAGD